jgi:hypothetical protein
MFELFTLCERERSPYSLYISYGVKVLAQAQVQYKTVLENIFGRGTRRHAMYFQAELNHDNFYVI